MMAMTLSRAPQIAGGALASLGGTAASLAGQGGLWAFSQFMRSPLAHSAILAASVLTLMATGNALYAQHGRHPAPLFMSAQDVPPTATSTEAGMVEDIAPVAPSMRPTALKAVPPVEQAAVAAPTVQSAAPDSAAIGNSDVYEVQKKLAAMGLFQGKVDGYYGPMTAAAIRAFESAAGLKPQGALNRSVIDAILQAPATSPIVARQPAPAAELVPQVLALSEPVRPAPAPAEQALAVLAQTPVPQETQAAALTAQAAITPLTAPAQTLQASAQTPAVGAVMANPSPTDAILDSAGDSAANAFDMVAGALQSITQPSQPVQAAALANASVRPPEPISSNDQQIVARVQRGLASLGFLAGNTDGIAGETTAKAIRNFEVYYNYPVTGRVTADLIPMLQTAGAAI